MTAVRKRCVLADRCALAAALVLAVLVLVVFASADAGLAVFAAVILGLAALALGAAARCCWRRALTWQEAEARALTGRARPPSGLTLMSTPPEVLLRTAAAAPTSRASLISETTATTGTATLFPPLSTSRI